MARREQLGALVWQQHSYRRQCRIRFLADTSELDATAVQHGMTYSKRRTRRLFASSRWSAATV